MGYLHINNLYKDASILGFKEVWALEKIHGTSAHISWKDNKLSFFSGGASYNTFVDLFDSELLIRLFTENFNNINLVIYGEAFGGKMQKMSKTYGANLQFIVFDVKIDDVWTTVLAAENIATKLGLEFVPYNRIPTTLEDIDAERDRDSEVAIRRGLGSHIREGVVLRPLFECCKSNGDRVICKHKREEFTERQNEPKVVDATKLEVLANASAIANEWVTPMRLNHVLDKFPDVGMERTRDVISAMIEDVYREGEGEIIQSKEAETAIGRKTAQLLKQYLQNKIKDIK
jgi:hypothetical protein